MIIAILLSSFTITVSTVPVRPDALPHMLSQGGATQVHRAQLVKATNKTPQTPAPLSPSLEQAQPGVPQQQGPQFVPSLQPYTWSPVEGSPMMIPLQPSLQEPQPANQPAPPQQPLGFPPYGYLPLFYSPYRNQMFSPYGFPMLFEAPLPQNPNFLPNSPASPAETPAGVLPIGDAPQPTQQNAQIVYMLQQPRSSPLGSLSSEELEMAAKMDQLGVYMPTVLANMPTGAALPVGQAAGLANPEQQGAAPIPSAVPQSQGLASCGPQLDAGKMAAGLERTPQDAVTQTPTHTQPDLRVQPPAKLTHTGKI